MRTSNGGGGGREGKVYLSVCLSVLLVVVVGAGDRVWLSLLSCVSVFSLCGFSSVV